MILSGLTPHRLTFAGRIALVGLAAALLPLAPSLGQSPKTDSEDKKPQTITVKVTGDEKGDVVTETRSFTFTSDDDDEKGPKSEKVKAEFKARIDEVVKEAKEQAVKARGEAGKARKAAEEVRAKTLFLRANGAKPPTDEDKAALEKAHAEMKEAQAALEKAAKRMAEIQMKIHGVPAAGVSKDVFFVPGHKVESKDIVIGHQLETKNVVISPKGGENIEVHALPEGKGQVRVFSRVVPGKPVEVKSGDIAELKGENVEIRTFTLPGGKGEIKVNGRMIVKDGEKAHTINVVPPKPPVPPVPPVPPTPPVTGSRVQLRALSTKDQDKRLEAMEKKLEVLLKELKALKAKEDK